MNNNSINSQEELTFEQLYRQYYADILLYARYSLNNPEETAKDITSDAFTKLLGKWSDFNPKTSSALIAWLRKTARFLTYNHNRKEQKLPTIPLEDITDHEDQTTSIETCTYEEHIKHIKNELTEEEFHLFEQIVIYNRTISQIAEKMNISSNTLKVRWFRLKKKIRQIL